MHAPTRGKMRSWPSRGLVRFARYLLTYPAYDGGFWNDWKRSEIGQVIKRARSGRGFVLKESRFCLLMAIAMAVPFGVHAAKFPEGAQQLSAERLQEFLPGKTFVGKVDGDTYTDTYNADNTMSGNGLGGKEYVGLKWSLVDKKNDSKDRLCVQGVSHYTKRACFEIGVSADGQTMYYKQGRDVYPVELRSN